MPTLRVVTANLLHGLDLATGRVDLEATGSALEPLGADVVAVQEVDRGLERSGRADQLAVLARRLGMNAAFAPALTRGHGGGWRRPGEHDDGAPGFGVGLLARPPLGNLRRVHLPGGGAGRPPARPRAPGRPAHRPPWPGWDREPRVALSASVPVAGAGGAGGTGTVRVTVAHLSYLPWRGLAGLGRALAAARAGDGGPAVLCGDLNLPAWLVRAVSRAARTAGRGTPAWRAAGGAPTYPAWRPVVQLDQLLVSGPVTVERASVAAGPSDHRMLVVDLHVGR